MDLELAKCARCDRLFPPVRSAVCAHCYDDEERDYTKIRDAMDQTPDLNVEQCSEAAGVQVACILRMLDEGRISNEGVGSPVVCGRCGAPAISPSKRLCETCLGRLNQQLAQEVQAARTRLRELKYGTTVREAVDEKRR